MFSWFRKNVVQANEAPQERAELSSTRNATSREASARPTRHSQTKTEYVDLSPQRDNIAIARFRSITALPFAHKFIEQHPVRIPSHRKVAKELSQRVDAADARPREHIKLNATVLSRGPSR